MKTDRLASRVTLRLLGALALLPLSGCFLFSSDHEEAASQSLKSVIFRLGSQADSVELRLEADYYPSHNWEVVARPSGKVDGDGVKVIVRGVREPREPKGSAAPAAAHLVLPRDPDWKGDSWPLVLVLQQKDQAEVWDKFKVERVGSGWRVTPESGVFSRYSAQGSY